MEMVKRAENEGFLTPNSILVDPRRGILESP